MHSKDKNECMWANRRKINDKERKEIATDTKMPLLTEIDQRIIHNETATVTRRIKSHIDMNIVDRYGIRGPRSAFIFIEV